MSQEGTGYFSQTIPARGTTKVSLDFEGSTWGAVTVLAKSAGVTVAFSGSRLEAKDASALGPGAFSYSVASDNPVNGELAIANTTGSPVAVAGYISILTRRHLTVVASTLFPHKGDDLSFDMSLSQATGADVVTATLVDEKGNATALSITKTGLGHWIGHLALASVGTFAIRASTTGTRFRAAIAQLEVAAGLVTLSSTFQEQVVDSDHDGLIDELDLTPTITVAVTGKYMANANLYDRYGAQVTGDLDGEIDLVAGAQPLKLRFGGKYIYESGRWGPYTLRVTVTHDTPAATIELDDAKLGDTAAYDYMQFQHNRLAVDPKSLSSKAVDTNGDGLFDELDVTGTVTVETAGTYDINSGLYGSHPWDQVAAEYMQFQFSPGENKFTVVYKGSDIAASSQDGPYEVPSFVVYLAADPMADAPSSSVNYMTAPYPARQFAR